MIKEFLGIAPQPNGEGAYRPSPLALKLATSSTTDYEAVHHSSPYQGARRRVLMLCTEIGQMVMKNGKKFATGNHPVEMLVPMLHLRDAGFEIDIFTPSGAPAQIESWAMPGEDEAVQVLYAEYRPKFEQPRSLADFTVQEMYGNLDYLAVFIPGGHGALLGLPTDPSVQQLLKWSREQGLYILSICHGPAALLAEQNERPFPYEGYSIAAFPDAVDKITPLIGYMPGRLPWKFGKKLKSLGVTIVNKNADSTCHVDRKLITAASPEAANEFGKTAVQELLKAN